MDISLLKQVLTTTNKIALSTSIDNQANVKIVNFVWFDNTPDTLYFSSVRGTNGVADYDKSPSVAIITIPNSDTIGNPYIRTQNVTLQHSDKVMKDLLPRYLETVPNYQKVWELIGPKLQVFELKLRDVYVDAGLDKEKVILKFKN
ncbi:pyridoxamine 5'-phosphate oxidase [Companilactobacillus allii]|uniref:Pyridoxamine 5'-phosphate oxidase n=1 Tax=Companilactobacillus allii TaxID=1847728 RepID=A0A1P8Q5P3_9LACO|nr:pyridoxamine 5'-phosphate oxidase [Companilactobacillus allii]APX73168.1 pyridoxamine 5'-phosphate oxidase [Companilactobacillus allii]USQ67975.1 pyridoxamine 5'-phosphate oxidase [Companilactobacillus allii]